MRVFEYRHVVAFEETNFLGNVYFTNHLLWQGRCREMFLREHAPSILGEFEQGLLLVTTQCSCEYLEELAPFDEISVHMTLGAVGPSRMTLIFEYRRNESLVARGSQHVACMRRLQGTMIPAALPSDLRAALESFA
jgi:enediyne biosynthesis thioesterase